MKAIPRTLKDILDEKSNLTSAHLSLSLAKAVRRHLYYPRLDHPERCRHCFSCVKICPPNAFDYEGESFTVDHERCLKISECLLCIQACPTGAITPHKPKKTN